jgi:uncharacterized protein YtpQ (UPF0354 family)
MFPLKKFGHPHSVYRLEYPAHWDQVIEKNGESCGFGPHERDDVGLWISIMPWSVDTDKLPDELPRLIQQALQGADAANLRRDTSLKHYGLVADITKEGQGGNYWILAGGDVVLFASSQVPVAERDDWNPPFLKVMASLQITREEQLLMRKVANDVMAELRKKHPDQDFEFEENRIRGEDRVVYLGNVFREVRASPSRREEIIKNFVNTLAAPATADIGHETWEDARGRIIPVLKPRNYLVPNTATEHLLTNEWLGEVVICYAIQSKKMYRFVTGWDLGRWGDIQPDALHEEAIGNLSRLPWPKQLEGARIKDGGRIIIVDTDDRLASSRLLHPDLHRLFSGPLGNPFWAGIPCRDTLVLYSDRRGLKLRTARRLRKDHDASAYPVSPRPFLVTRDGIALGADA